MEPSAFGVALRALAKCPRAELYDVEPAVDVDLDLKAVAWPCAPYWHIAQVPYDPIRSQHVKHVELRRRIARNAK